jgi:hypothetical protein
MGAKPLSKTKIVAHLAEKVGAPKKQAALFFEELHKLAVKEAKAGAGKFVIPTVGPALKTHRRTRAARHKAALHTTRRKPSSDSDKALSTLADAYSF